MSDVFITALGKFFPGPPIPNDQLEDYLGLIHGRPARAKGRVLAQNGIQTRHYALDKQQRTLYRNSELAANAVRDLLERVALDGAVDFLGAATTQGDLCVPGFASMVHGELGFPACEIASLGGVCASGVVALKNAYLQVRVGDKRNAVACGSELPSRLFKASRYEAYVPADATLPFDAEFLRWMLSDGAGAALLQPAPAVRGVSLRIDWMDIRSYAHEHATCMYAGGVKRQDGSMGPGWLDYPTFDAAGAEGALFLRQDVRQLDALVRLGVDGFFRLVDEGRLVARDIDHVVCHYSSQFFRTRILELLAAAGAPLPEDKWFSNLTTRGNVGAASVFVLLEELVNGGHVRPGPADLRHDPGERAVRRQLHEADRGGRRFPAARSTHDVASRRRVARGPARAGAEDAHPRDRAAGAPAGARLDRLRDAPAPGADRREAGDGPLHPRRLQAAAAEPAPAGRRGGALDRARGVADGRRTLPAAQPVHRQAARARGAPRLRAARTQLRERRRRHRRHPRRRQERRQRSAVGVDVPPRQPGQPVRPAGRDVHHRRPGRAARGALGRR